MNRRLLLSFPMAAIPGLAAGEMWAIPAGTKIVDLTYWKPVETKLVTVRCEPKELWFGQTPPLYPDLWYIRVESMSGERIDVSLQDVRHISYAR